jgi:hypothetical protein
MDYSSDSDSDSDGPLVDESYHERRTNFSPKRVNELMAEAEELTEMLHPLLHTMHFYDTDREDYGIDLVSSFDDELPKYAPEKMRTVKAELLRAYRDGDNAEVMDDIYYALDQMMDYFKTLQRLPKKQPVVSDDSDSDSDWDDPILRKKPAKATSKARKPAVSDDSDSDSDSDWDAPILREKPAKATSKASGRKRPNAGYTFKSTSLKNKGGPATDNQKRRWKLAKAAMVKKQGPFKAKCLGIFKDGELKGVLTGRRYYQAKAS